MSNANAKIKNSDFDQLQGEEAKSVRDYWPMMARNAHTGKIQQVVLFAPNVFNTLPALVKEDHPELREDLRRALSHFNSTQRRVLFRVLVQGQSIETATRGSKWTSQRWRKWFGQAVQQLRGHLADYVENGKVVIG